MYKKLKRGGGESFGTKAVDKKGTWPAAGIARLASVSQVGAFANLERDPSGKHHALQQKQQQQQQQKKNVSGPTQLQLCKDQRSSPSEASFSPILGSWWVFFSRNKKMSKLLKIQNLSKN